MWNIRALIILNSNALISRPKLTNWTLAMVYNPYSTTWTFYARLTIPALSWVTLALICIRIPILSWWASNRITFITIMESLRRASDIRIIIHALILFPYIIIRALLRNIFTNISIPVCTKRTLRVSADTSATIPSSSLRASPININTYCSIPVSATWASIYISSRDTHLSIPNKPRLALIFRNTCKTIPYLIRFATLLVATIITAPN